MRTRKEESASQGWGVRRKGRGRGVGKSAWLEGRMGLWVDVGSAVSRSAVSIGTGVSFLGDVVVLSMGEVRRREPKPTGIAVGLGRMQLERGRQANCLREKGLILFSPMTVPAMQAL